MSNILKKIHFLKTRRIRFVGEQQRNQGQKLHLPKKLENFSALRVADVTISLKSRRRATTCFRIPNRTSVFKDRSCASSIITTLPTPHHPQSHLRCQLMLHILMHFSSLQMRVQRGRRSVNFHIDSY